MIRVNFKKLSENAQIPSMPYGEEEAGIDLHAAEEVLVPARGQRLVSTGIAWAPEFDGWAMAERGGVAADNAMHFLEDIDRGLSVASPNELFGAMSVMFNTMIKLNFKTYMKIQARSGLCAKRRVYTLAGTIDSSYRGDIKIMLKNDGDRDYRVKVGERIAQGVVYVIPRTETVGAVDLPESVRGENGFGSSGE